jgi:hypothetical protein
MTQQWLNMMPLPLSYRQKIQRKVQVAILPSLPLRPILLQQILVPHTYRAYGQDGMLATVTTLGSKPDCRLTIHAYRLVYSSKQPYRIHSFRLQTNFKL